MLEYLRFVVNGSKLHGAFGERWPDSGITLFRNYVATFAEMAVRHETYSRVRVVAFHVFRCVRAEIESVMRNKPY